MPSHKTLIYIGLGAAVAGFFLANAPSNTGIYASFIGNTAANVWSKGNGLATGATTPAATT